MSAVDCPLGPCNYRAKASNVRRHLESKHQFTDEEMKTFDDALIDARAKKKGGAAWICPCNHRCGSLRGIRGHIEKKHPNNQKKMLENVKQDDQTHMAISIEKSSTKKKTTSGTRYKCPMENCEDFAPSRKELCNHLSSHGDEKYAVEEHVFENKLAFEKWYSYKCESTCTTHNRYRLTKDGGSTTYYYKCSNQGSYKSRATRNLGHKSKKNTEGKLCSSYLKAQFNNITGVFEVEGCFEHFSHEPQWAELRYSVTQLNIIRKLIEDGLYDQQIIDKLRKEYPMNSRLYYIVRDDIRFLREKFDLYPGRYDKDDLSSIECRFNLNNDQDGFVYFRKPIDNTGKDFAMVIMTPLQVEYLERFSEKGVIMDDTHNVTRYDLKLTTILVVDENDRGFPCGFLLSNSTSSKEMEIIFNEIKKVMPKFCPKVMMTDEAGAFWKGYMEVFPQNRGKTQKLMCKWHIGRAWTKNLKLHLEKQHQPALQQILNEILGHPSQYVVETSINQMFQFLSDLKTPGADKFTEYFKSYYMGKIQQWSVAYRDEAIAQTSMFAESWHSLLKNEFLHRKVQIRIDSLLYSLHQALETIARRRFVDDKKDLARSNLRKAEQRKMHRAALDQQNNYVISIFDEDHLEIIHKKDSKRRYIIAHERRCNCEEKNNHCNFCDVCWKNTTCTCLKQMAGVSCKHCHMAVMEHPSFFAKISEEMLDGEDPESSFEAEHLLSDDIVLDMDDNILTAVEESDLIGLDDDDDGDIQVLDEEGETERDRIADELTTTVTHIRNASNLLESEILKISHSPSDENLDKATRILEHFEEMISELGLFSHQAALPIRAGVANSNKRKTTKVVETMNFTLGTRNKDSKKRKTVNFDPIVLDPSTCYICDYCKLADSPFSTSTGSQDSSLFRSCQFCGIRVHINCLPRNGSACRCNNGFF